VGPETLERINGKPFKARLGANESAFGISPLARQAIRDAAGIQGCSWYGDPENHTLRSLLAEKHQIEMSNICVDAGIDSLIGLTIRLFVERGDTVVTSDGAYPTVNYHVSASGGVIHKVPYKNNHEDPVALLEAAKQQNARLVYLANPDNPMGTSLDAVVIQELIDDLPKGCLLMLDEAYIEFMAHRPVLPLTVDSTQMIRFRTFSKAYGMAGMRIGYVLAHHDIVNGYNRIRNHFGVPRLSQIAAEASLNDDGFLKKVQDCVDQGRQRIYQLADTLGLNCIPSATNFVTVDIGDSERAVGLIHALGKEGVFMRKPMVAPQNRYVRIGIGTEEEHEHLESALRKCL
jgi:histidinol-phosphate aminotransferase